MRVTGYKAATPSEAKARRFLARFLLAAFLLVGLWVGLSCLMPTRYVAPMRVGDFSTRPRSAALMAAIAANNIVEVKRLLESGVSPDAVESYRGENSDEGASALQVVAALGYLPIAQLLLDHGADINAPNDWGDTALIDASRSGNVAIVKLLVSRGADVNADDDGMTALGYVELSKYKKR